LIKKRRKGEDKEINKGKNEKRKYEESRKGRKEEITLYMIN
jgi:hypothetical protein